MKTKDAVLAALATMKSEPQPLLDMVNKEHIKKFDTSGHDEPWQDSLGVLLNIATAHAAKLHDEAAKLAVLELVRHVAEFENINSPATCGGCGQSVQESGEDDYCRNCGHYIGDEPRRDK